MIPQKNIEKSNGRHCRIWEIGKEDAQTEYPSVVAAARDIGYNSTTTVHTILKNNTCVARRGEYIVE